MSKKNVDLKMKIFVFFFIFIGGCTPKSDPGSDGYSIKVKKLFDAASSIDHHDLDAKILKNKIVIINFWASWCQPCMEETPSLLRLVDKFKNDVVLLSISVDDSKKDLEKFISLFPMAKASNIFLIHDQQLKWREAFSIFKFPETYVLDRNLKLNKKFEGAIPFNNIEVVKYFDSLVLTKQID